MIRYVQDAASHRPCRRRRSRSLRLRRAAQIYSIRRCHLDSWGTQLSYRTFKTRSCPALFATVITRCTFEQQSGQTWFKDLHIPVHKTDYTVPSLLTIFNDTYATAVISFVNDPTPTYVSTHAALLGACGQSNTCKRLIPSEWIGNSESYPLKPDYYATSREPFRQLLKQQTEVEWTLLNTGWLADYFLPKEKTHMKPVPLEFPVDPSRWRALVRGTGDDLQSWTCARDVGRAVVELCKANEWVCGGVPLRCFIDSYSSQRLSEEDSPFTWYCAYNLF